MVHLFINYIYWLEIFFPSKVQQKLKRRIERKVAKFFGALSQEIEAIGQTIKKSVGIVMWKPAISKQQPTTQKQSLKAFPWDEWGDLQYQMPVICGRLHPEATCRKGSNRIPKQFLILFI